MKFLRLPFILLNLIAAMLLICSTLAGAVAPSHFVWLSLLSYAYFPLLLVNLGFVAFWLIFSNKWFLLSAIAIVVRWSFVPLFFQVGGAPEEPTYAENTMKVMTFNMHHLYGHTYIADEEEKSDADSNAIVLLDLLHQENPDVLFFQEFLSHSKHITITDSLDAMGYKWYASAVPDSKGSASICWSKYPIADIVYIDSVLKVQADVVKGTDTIRIVSIHLNSYGLTKDNMEELDKISHGEVHNIAETGTLKKFRETILSHDKEWNILAPIIDNTPYPIIIAGDFNDTPASYIYQKMSKKLNDSYKEKGKGFCTTYHGRFPAFRIDYIMHSPQLKALSYKRIKTDISDHYPIFVEMELIK